MSVRMGVTATTRRRMSAWLALASALLCASALSFATTRARSQLGDPSQSVETAAERAAVALLEGRNFVRARDSAAAILRTQPSSFVAHFVLAVVQHEAEANFPVGLHHAKQARSIFEGRYGSSMGPGSPWMWHARLLLLEAELEGEVGNHERRLALLERFNETYQPKRIAERAWSLMKLGRYEDARRAAAEGIASGSMRQEVIAYNALCAIEYEAGRDGRSYAACRRALELGRASPGGPQVVDLTNFAEAARAELSLEESERVLLEATEVESMGYGNPWLELGELYLREGRFAEALDALKRVPAYRMQRPPSMREADRNESRRAVAALFLLLGRPDEAVRITDRALVAPDRRSHSSRDPAQDQAVVALVDRAARLDLAELVIEQAVAKPYHARVAARVRAMVLRFEAWQSGRRVAQLLADGGRLAGLFAVGTAKSGVTPPWLVGDLVEILGPGPVLTALHEARSADGRERAPGYYDAFEAEAHASRGDVDEARSIAARALERLPSQEVTLGLRMRGVLAELALDEGPSSVSAVLSPLFERDPSLLRRRGIVVPARFGVGGELGDALASALRRSPRFDDESTSDLTLTIEADASHARACLSGSRRESFGCVESTPRAGERDQDFVQRVVDELHRVVFSPRVDLSQTDVASLDGSPRSSRDPLRGLQALEEP